MWVAGAVRYYFILLQKKLPAEAPPHDAKEAYFTREWSELFGLFASGVNAPLRVLHIIPQTRMETTLMFILYSFVILYVEASHALMFSVFVCVNVLVRSWVCRDWTKLRFVAQAFDMQRDLQITPRRLEYTREKEGELFSSLMAIANRKQEEMKEMIVETLSGMKEQLLEEAANLEFTGQKRGYRDDQ